MYDYMHQAMLDRITEIGKQRQRIDSLYFWGREFVKRYNKLIKAVESQGEQIKKLEEPKEDCHKCRQYQKAIVKAQYSLMTFSEANSKAVVLAYIKEIIKNLEIEGNG